MVYNNKVTKGETPMQLTAQGGNMVVDFYPVKMYDGSIHNRLMLKIVTFMGGTQSKSYINKVNMQREIDSRVHGYNYDVTGFNTDAQLYNSAMGMAC